jgi:hypothetical protein
VAPQFVAAPRDPHPIDTQRPNGQTPLGMVEIRKLETDFRDSEELRTTLSR